LIKTGPGTGTQIRSKRTKEGKKGGKREADASGENYVHIDNGVAGQSVFGEKKEDPVVREKREIKKGLPCSLSDYAKPNMSSKGHNNDDYLGEKEGGIKTPQQRA